MLGTFIKPKFRPLDYDILAGLDVDKRHIDVTFSDHEQQMKSLRMPYSADHLLAYTRRHFPGKRLAFAYEAGPTGYGLYDRITSAGHPCLVVAPSLVPTAPGHRVKTNRIDSRKISCALRGGELKSIHVPPPSYRQLRQLVQLRDTLVHQAVSSQVRIKALLLFENIPFPDPRGRWTLRSIAGLRTLSCPPPIRFKLDRLLENLAYSQKQVQLITREIRRFCQNDSKIALQLNLLLTVPGIGRIIGTHLLARLGGPDFLHHSRQLSGFVGVVPCEHSTGEDLNRGSITRAGDRRLRAKLIQASWVAIRRDTELYDFYLRIYRRNPKPIAPQKAITAVANKLCKRIACVLKEQRPYVVRRANLAAIKEETATSQGETRIPAEPAAPSAA